MCSTVASTTEGNLHDPTLRRALAGIIEYGFLIEAEEDFLDHVLGFIAVIQDAKSYCEHQPRIPAEKQVQSLRILGYEASHEFFIAGEAGWANLNRLRRWDRVLPACPPYHGECQRAPIQRRTHFKLARSLVLLDPKHGTLNFARTLPTFG
jgi:hypothetical protein